jgi:hypothetical protein
MLPVALIGSARNINRANGLISGNATRSYAGGGHAAARRCVH